MAKVCLITPGQPSINPRLVKEADALLEAGHKVHVLCSHMVDWADDADKKLLATREWTCSYIGGERNSWPYRWTRLRHGLVRKFPSIWDLGTKVGDDALARVTPELVVAAEAHKADLYIAHYVGALSAAARAAKKHGGHLAFDAEDFESGCYRNETGPQRIDRLIENVEREYLGECCYITAASPGIAAAYQTKYGIAKPTSILNVFPLAERPEKFRTTAASGPMRLHWFSQTIGPTRGLEDVIRAMGVLQGYHVELHLRGFAPSGYREHLHRLAMANGVEARAVKFHAPLSSAEMICAAAEFDVGLALEQPISLNRDICLTNKIFSYLLAGNAIAASNTSGQRAIMQQIGNAGFLFGPGDVKGLAEGLHRWYHNREELHRTRQHSWLWGTRSFNWDLEKIKFLNVVSEVLDPRCLEEALPLPDVDC